MPLLQNAGIFLLQSVFDFFIFICLLRIFFIKFRIDFYNPMSQWVWKMTNPILRFLKPYFPVYHGIELSSIALTLALQLIKFSLIMPLQTGYFPNIIGLLIFSVADTLVQTTNIFFYALILRVLISWINPGIYNPAIYIITRLTDPLLLPFQRLLPLVGGIDLSPIATMFILKLANILLIEPLFILGKGFI